MRKSDNIAPCFSLVSKENAEEGFSRTYEVFG